MSHNRKVFPCLAFLSPQSQSADQPTVTSKNIKMSSAVVFMAVTCQKAAVFMCIWCGCLWYCIQSMFETELDIQGEKADVKWHFFFFLHKSPHLCERVYMTRNSQHADTDTHFPFSFTSLPANEQPWLTPKWHFNYYEWWRLGHYLWSLFHSSTDAKPFQEDLKKEQKTVWPPLAACGCSFPNRQTDA